MNEQEQDHKLRLGIAKIEDLFINNKLSEVNDGGVLENINLIIPDYQRPYKWTVGNVIRLLDDIEEAWKNDRRNYRVGTLILHHEKDNNYNIVDGQQRTVTFSLILKAFFNVEMFKGYFFLLKIRTSLRDLTDNLCIMYKEGEKYYFIHRSFQEYFTAVYFASGFDTKLINVGKFFDTNGARNYDKTFDMLYDMIPSKVERFIFMPYLEKLLAGKGRDAYWSFLESVFGYLYYDCATNLDCPPSGYSKPFLYEKIYNLIRPDLFDRVVCPGDIDISIEALNKEIYTELCVPCDPTGTDVYMGVELPISAVRQHPEKFPNVRRWVEADDFFMMQEYNNVKAYYEKLRRRIQDEEDSDDLFD